MTFNCKDYLPAGGKIRKRFGLDMKYYDLKSGQYHINIIYCSGKNLYNLVPKQEVLRLEEKYKAKEFRGWVKSNTLKVKIE